MHRHMFIFDAVQPIQKQFRLKIPLVSVKVWSGESFQVDLGPNPQPGQVLTMDTQFSIGQRTFHPTCSEADDGTIAVTLTGHDPSVAVEQAQNLLDEIAKGEIAGPWEFTITEIER